MKNILRCCSLFLLLFAGILSCKDSVESAGTGDSTEHQAPSPIRLQSLPASETGVDFVNQINDEGKVNIFTWHFLYNGAGVAAGDINNDGLPDLYFTGCMVPDKLYLNKGNFEFEDITSRAGISTKLWSSGVTMADVNADGLTDIYVCKNSPTGIPDNNRNLLYINMGKNVFREQAAKYGLDDIGFGVQSTFFDADNDGDLDMYLVNQPFDEFSRLVNRPDVVANYPVTDRFFFYENGKFVDRTAELGMTDDRYGLNVSLGDFDLNGWTDMYICNDYHHGDRYYLNQGGKFIPATHTHAGHTSFYSMGSDVADVNQDGWLDLVTLDMAFEEHYRSKTNMGSMNADRFWELVEQGHHHQYMQNGLQMNMGKGYFSEMAQVAGIAKSDWSYSSLFADLDIDGDQDLLITNGILRDLRNNDFQVYVRDKYQNQVGPHNYLEVLKNIPSTPIPNIIFNNDGDAHFSKMPPEAGFDEGSFSHGMVVSDLDRDGKLDVVINNMNSPASVYKNVTETSGHFISVRLKGKGNNVEGLGSSVIVYAAGKKQINTMQTTRGYFSGCEPLLYFGLGNVDKIDSIKVIWDHEHTTVSTHVPVDKEITIKYDKKTGSTFFIDPADNPKMADVSLADHMHTEKNFDDYKLQVLLPYKQSQNGPHISVGDFNGDGREDFFIGGSAGNAGKVYVQDASGGFRKTNQPAFEKDKNAEDQESVIFDADQDQDPDLLVTSGSNEFAEGSKELSARLYLNNGDAVFQQASKDLFPLVQINGQCVEVFDADGDKDMDIFLGGRIVSGKYPVPPSSVILINDSGKFRDETKSFAPFLTSFGLITDAVQEDIDADGDADLLVVGEWMKPTWLINSGKEGLTMETVEAAGTGLWWTVEKIDIDGDNDSDFILGNLGWNNKFGGSKGTKLEVFANDFDQNGDYDVVLATTKQDKLLPIRGRECSSQEMPFILNKFPDYESYARAGLKEILTEEQLGTSTHQKLSTMSSVLLINDGNYQFTVHTLPPECQAGAVKAIYADDFNKDGKMDFIYAGNHFPTEVETARYDGLYPGICFNDGNGELNCKTFFIGDELRIDDIRDIQKINVNGKPVYLLSNNAGPLRAYAYIE